MKKIFLLPTTMFLLMAFTIYNPNSFDFNPKESTINKTETIKVLSYNVRHCNPPSKKGIIDVASIAKVINEVQPDLVALQEIDRFTNRSGVQLDQAKELGKLTGMYSYFVKAIDYDGGEYGIAILSRLKILDSIQLHLPMAKDIPGEGRAVAIVKVRLKNNREILFASTHLDIVKEHRELQTNAIMNYFNDSKLPVIIAGDFNDTPESSNLQNLKRHFNFTCSSLDCGKTFPQINPTSTIDYIMYSPKKGIKTKVHQVINNDYASDHRPLIATIKIP